MQQGRSRASKHDPFWRDLLSRERASANAQPIGTSQTQAVLGRKEPRGLSREGHQGEERSEGEDSGGQGLTTWKPLTVFPRDFPISGSCLGPKRTTATPPITKSSGSPSPKRARHTPGRPCWGAEGVQGTGCTCEGVRGRPSAGAVAGRAERGLARREARHGRACLSCDGDCSTAAGPQQRRAQGSKRHRKAEGMRKTQATELETWGRRPHVPGYGTSPRVCLPSGHD